MPQRPLHCFAYLHQGAWGAICLDLDISVRGATLDDVKARLAAEVDAHILGRRVQDPQASSARWRRGASFSVRAKCYARYLFAALLQPAKIPAEQAEFVLARRL